MKKLMLLFAVLALLTTCKKDEDSNPCANVECLNGGTCVTGTCNCINGYTGANCQIAPDPCAGLNCQNGGTCINGTCNCPSGYGGTQCEIIIPATALKINSITVTRWPQTDNGGGWDLTSGPELYPKIVETNGGTVIYDSPSVAQDATPGSWLFSQGLPVTLQSGVDYSIEVYDYDTSDPDDFMAGMRGVIPGNYDNAGFPTTISLTSTDVDVTLSVTWVH